MNTKTRKLALEGLRNAMDEMTIKLRAYPRSRWIPLGPAQLVRYIRGTVESLPLLEQRDGLVTMSVPEMSALIFAAKEWLAIYDHLGKGLGTGAPLIAERRPVRRGREAS